MATFDAAGGRAVPAGIGGRRTTARGRDEYLRALVAAASCAAAVVHFAFMASHFDEHWAYGSFFAVVGWLQLVWAVAVVRRPSRAVVLAGVGNLGIVAVWVLSRTVGVGIGPNASTAEAVAFPDVLATVLEVVVATGALVLAAEPRALRRAVVRAPMANGIAVFGALVFVVAATVAVTPRYAGGHDGHGHPSAGHDAAGHVHAASTLTGTTPCERAGPPASEGQVTDSSGHFHRGPAPQDAMDEATRLQLQAQQETARQVAARFPTVADAERAGYARSTVYVPCIGAHYTNARYALTFDPAHPSELLYDGIEPSARIVGLSYLVFHPAGPPEGFAGPNDRWHQHNLNGGLCLRGGEVIGAEQTSAAECAARGGRKVPLDGVWMVHDWVVPGFECSWGVFASECPELGGRVGGTAWDAPDPSGRPIPQG